MGKPQIYYHQMCYKYSPTVVKR